MRSDRELFEKPRVPFPSILNFLGKRGISQAQFGSSLGRNQSSISRGLRTSADILQALRELLSQPKHRARFFEELKDPVGPVWDDLVNLAAFRVTDLADPEHIAQIDDLFFVGPKLTSILTPGACQIIEAVLRDRTDFEVVLFTQETLQNHSDFVRFCQQIKRSGLDHRLLTLSLVTTSSGALSLAPTVAISCPRTPEFRLGLVGLFNADRSSSLATVLAGQATHEIAVYALEILAGLDENGQDSFVDSTGTHWKRLRGNGASAGALPPAATLLDAITEALKVKHGLKLSGESLSSAVQELANGRSVRVRDEGGQQIDFTPDLVVQLLAQACTSR